MTQRLSPTTRQTLWWLSIPVIAFSLGVVHTAGSIADRRLVAVLVGLGYFLLLQLVFYLDDKHRA